MGEYNRDSNENHHYRGLELFCISSSLGPNASTYRANVLGMVLPPSNRYAVTSKTRKIFANRDQGVILNIARSRLAVPSQLAFLALNATATLLGTIYHGKTPDLYEHNMHNTFGWLLMWIVVSQTLMIVLRRHGLIAAHEDHRGSERGHYQAVTLEAMQQHQANHPRQPGDYRYSHDSGHGTEPESSNSQSSSPMRNSDEDPFHKCESPQDDDLDVEGAENRTLLRVGGSAPGGFLTRVRSRLSRRTIRAIDIIINVIDRVIVVLGFIGIITGVVVYGGIFVSDL